MAASAPLYDAWFSERQLDELAAEFGEPGPALQIRRDSFRSFRDLPIEPDPLYRKYAYFGGVDLAGVDPIRAGPPVALPPLSDNTIRVVHDASGTRVDVPPSLLDGGLRVRTLRQLREEDGGAVERFLRPWSSVTDKLTALGSALVNRGVEIEVPDRMERPIRIQDVTVLSRPHEVLSIRRRIVAGSESRLLVSEEVRSTDDSSDVGQRLHSSASTVELSDGATLHYLTVHAPDPSAVSLYARDGRAGRRASLNWVWTGFGGFRIRARNSSELHGAGSVLNDLQTFYGDREQAYDSAIRITHVGTDTHGQSITRGVFRDTSRGMSRGLVRIEKDARKTISFISEHAMLLSRGARSDTIPILEILCRDVKATHSTSVAPVDPERIFYLQSRGIEPNAAIRMISEGFLTYVLDRAPLADLATQLHPDLETRWQGGWRSWREGAWPILPDLRVTPAGPQGEWRFDAKLR